MQQILLKKWYQQLEAGGRGIALAGQRLRDLYTQISIVFNKNLASEIIALICIQSLRTGGLYPCIPILLDAIPQWLVHQPGGQVWHCTHPLARLLPCQVHMDAFLVESIPSWLELTAGGRRNSYPTRSAEVT